MKKLLHLAIPLVTACLLLGGLYFLAGVGQASAINSPSTPQASILVSTLEDELNNDGDCSLREAVIAANENSAVDACPAGDGVYTDTITFDVAGIITITSQLSVTAGGPVDILGGGAIAVSGDDSVRVMQIGGGAHVYLENLTITDGEEFYGGGIWNFGTLVVSDCTFSSNQAWVGAGIINNGTSTVHNSIFIDNGISYSGAGFYNNGGVMNIYGSILFNNHGGYGGAIGNSGSLTITDSIISGNDGDNGAGIENDHGTLTLIDSTVSGNNANQRGGGIYNQASAELTLIRTLLSQNHAGEPPYVDADGGGIVNLGSLYMLNSTLSGNDAYKGTGGIGRGGGINNSGTANITNSTLTGNNANEGGGIYDSSGTLSIINSIVANSINGGECNQPIHDGGHNIDSGNTCDLDPNISFPDSNPHLGSLQDNGGPTWTHALLWHSSALDAGDNDDCPPTDQRGLPRPMDGDGDGIAICDIGAFEAQEPVFPAQILFLPAIVSMP